MKVLAIRGQNLASLEGEFELSLGDGPLSEAGVFAICGPTGAGKSTLLDAMCLALYDTAPRVDGRSRVRIGREACPDPITTTDPRSFLRKGAGAGFAEVDFRGVDERVYRARWEVRRARSRPDGKLQPTTMALSLVGTDERWEGRKTDVKDEIERRLGLSFDQFRRSVLLAQGDFAAFLTADARDRADLLERMTGTSIYGRISIEAHERAARERQALAQQEALREAVELLAPEAREALSDRCDELTLATRQAELGWADAGEALRWHHEREALLREEVAAAEAKSTIEQQLAVWETRRQELEELEAVRPLRPRFVVAEEAGAHLAERALERESADAVAARAIAERDAARGAAEQAQNAFEAQGEAREATRAKVERARALDARIEAAAQTTAQARARAEAVGSREADAAAQAKEVAERAATLAAEASGHARWLEADAAASLLADRSRLEERLDAWVEVVVAQAALEAQRVEARGRLEQAGRADAAAAGRLLGIERTRSELELAWIEARDAAAAEPSEALVSVRERWTQRRTALETLHGVADKAEEAHSAEARHRDKARRAVDAVARAEASGAEASRAAQVEGIRLEELEAQRDRVRAALDLSARRAELVDGDPCPLCGSDDHPYAHEAPALDALLGDADARLREARERHRRAETDAAVAAEDVLRWRARAAEATAEADAWRDALERARADYRATARDLGTDGTAWPEELPEAPEDRRDWGPLFALADAEKSGALLSSDARHGLRRAREEAAERLREIEAAERARRERERAADALRSRWEDATRDEAGARREREAAQRALDVAVHEASGLEKERDRLASERTRLERALDPALSAWWRRRSSARPAARAWASGLELQGASGGALGAWTDRAAAPTAFAAVVRREAGARADRQATLDRVQSAAQELAPATERLEAQLEHLRERLAEATAAHEAALAVEQTLRQERAAVLEGDADAAEARSRAALDSARAAAAQARASLDAAERACAHAEARRAQAGRDLEAAEARAASERAALDAALEAAGLDREAALARLRMDVEEIERWRAELERLDRERAEAEAVHAERARKRLAHEADEPPALDHAAAEARRSEMAREIERLRERLHAERGRLERDDLARERAAELDAKIVEAREAVEVWITLAELIGSASGNKLRVFAQSLTLELLLDHANHQLRDLAPRYALQRVPGEDLALQVVDHEMGDEVRSVESLSGGESFLVALGLALGLASLSSERARVDSLFIDEGFGALDAESLETVLGTLELLRASGRQVGLISHIPTVAERFETRVQVVPAGPARSRVELVHR